MRAQSVPSRGRPATERSGGARLILAPRAVLRTAFPAARRRRGDVFQAIAEPTRRRLMDLLGHGEQPVNRLAAGFAMTRPAISQHLGVLRRAGLVTLRRVGREHRYRLRPAHLREVHNWVAHYKRFWKRRLKALGDYLNREAELDHRIEKPKRPKEER